MKRSLQLKYPEFARAAETVVDKFWEDSLNAASKGKFSSRIVEYAAGQLSIKGKRDLSVKIDKGNPVEVARVFIEFMRSNLSLLSDRDLEGMRTADGNDKKVRERLKTKILRYPSEYHRTLSAAERSSLASVLSFGVDIGIITAASLKIIDGVIASIEGVEYNASNCKFSLSNKILTSSNASYDVTRGENDLIDIYLPRSLVDTKLRKMELGYEREINRLCK